MIWRVPDSPNVSSAKPATEANPERVAVGEKRISAIPEVRFASIISPETVTIRADAPDAAPEPVTVPDWLNVTDVEPDADAVPVRAPDVPNEFAELPKSEPDAVSVEDSLKATVAEPLISIDPSSVAD
jgi:hypothetical protein